ncbi:MAG: AAA family ATPase [Spirochaetales bacterium]|nr:AAA family ATPase [Spirochaetales bacterium]
MKIAVTGKGGVGKTTISGLLARAYNDLGNRVMLIDADPDMNLAGVLGIPEQTAITPIIELKNLIADRTGTEPGRSAPLFKMNPRVDDIPEKYSFDIRGIKLLVMGTVRGGGAGCACPENAFLKSLLSHLFLARDECVIVDMEAGIEHLGRGTAMGVDMMLIVAEPSKSSLDTAGRIQRLAKEIGITKLTVLVNKVKNSEESDYMKANLEKHGFDIIGYLDYSSEIQKINLGKINVFDIKGRDFDKLKHMISALEL